MGLPRSTVAVTRRRAFPRRPLSQDVDLALRALKAMPSVQLVIIDTWRFWANLPAKAENDAGSVSAAFQQIARLAAAGYAVLIIHHNRKSGGEEGTAAAGSNALTGAADILLEVKRFGKASGGESATSMRTLSALGRHQRIPPETVVDFRDGRYASMGPADDARKNQRLDKIRAFLTESGKWMTTEQIEAGVGMKSSACLASLRSLHALHQIQRVGMGSRGSAFLYAGLNVPLHESGREAT